MFRWLALIFLVVPFVALWILLRVGDWIGFWPTVGLVLAEAWKFPIMIQRAIGHHHAPQQEDMGRLAAIVHVADAIVDALDLSGNGHSLVPQLHDSVWDRLALEPAQLRAVFRDTELQFEEACQILAP